MLAVSVTSNAAQIIDTQTNTVVRTLRTGRAPHEGFISPDGETTWVAIRSENFVEIFNADTGSSYYRAYHSH